jgi:toxin HigB-1
MWRFHGESLSLAVVTRDVSMIRSFGDKETEQIWEGKSVRKLPLEVQVAGRRKLRMLNNAQLLGDLIGPPSNRLEKLLGSKADFYSIRINDQWRIVFKWDDGFSEKVSITDYHS